MYKFWKHNNEWRYKHKLDAAGKPIDTFALERVLGVIGGPLVIVIRNQPDGRSADIQINNGFIERVGMAVPVSPENEKKGIPMGIMSWVEVEEFYAEEISL